MSDRDLHERASSLFLDLRALPAEERDARLAAEAPDVAAEVRSLLSHDAELDGKATADPGEALRQSADTPARIGPYTVLGRIGHGAAGFVLLAEQREPVRRRVAIKIVPHAAISPEFAARFEFERRALERTDHPGIARILDAGRTADGLPYLVMDFVDGPPITAFCEARRLPLHARIGLMLAVCDAVQHAHQRGVIHRDLKPANILVSFSDGHAAPRILDFGIAKPTGDTATLAAAPTSGVALGTPAYMAPEQTGGQPVDTRADVYGLGAILYELACGRPPIDVSGDTLAVLRRIREQPPSPASRIRAAASTFAFDPLPRSFLTDLDCILAKALEKHPARRYPTVAALADDLRRLLDLEPIAARPASPLYRASRFIQRNRLLTAASALALMALIVGVAGLGAGLIEAQRQRANALDQTQAQHEINQFLTDDILAAASPDELGEKATALDLVRHASSAVDERFATRPLIAAAIHHTLGVSFTRLGAFDDAQRHLNRALELRRSAAGPDAVETVHTEIALAGLLDQRQKLKEARAALRTAVDRARTILGPDDPALYAALNDLGTVCAGLDQGQDAASLLSEALAGRTRLLGEHDPQVLMTMSNLADAYDRLGKTDLALKTNLDALSVAEKLEPPPTMTILGLCNNIGATYQDLNRERDAEPYLRRAADMAAKWIGPDNPDTLTIQANLAGLEAKLGDPAHAAELLDSIIKTRTRILGEGAYDTLTARYAYWDALWLAKRFDDAATGYAALLPDLARALGDDHWLAAQTRASLARALRDGGHPDQALPLAQRAADQFLALYGPEHARTKNTAALLNQIKAALAASSASAPSTPASPAPEFRK